MPFHRGGKCVTRALREPRLQRKGSRQLQLGSLRNMRNKIAQLANYIHPGNINILIFLSLSRMVCSILILNKKYLLVLVLAYHPIPWVEGPGLITFTSIGGKRSKAYQRKKMHFHTWSMRVSAGNGLDIGRKTGTKVLRGRFRLGRS